MSAGFPRCAACGTNIRPGQSVLFLTGDGVTHLKCPGVTCAVCANAIKPGEAIQRRDDESLVHERCWVHREHAVETAMADQAPFMSEVPPRDQQPLRGVHVLLVEDHRDTRDVYEQVLTALGAVVMATSGADAAVPHLPEADVVVTDIAMPDRDGVWLLEKARKKVPDVPVIAVSGHVPERSARIANAAFDLLLLKPVDPWKLGADVVAVLRKHDRIGTVRARLASAALPSAEATKVVGRTSMGAVCSGCADRILAGQIEYELEFANALRFRLHRSCYLIWEQERGRARREINGSSAVSPWTLLEQGIARRASRDRAAFGQLLIATGETLRDAGAQREWSRRLRAAVVTTSGHRRVPPTS